MNDDANVEEFYSTAYWDVFNDRKIAPILKLIHKQLDKPFKNKSNLEIIELGAGHGQHFQQTKLQTKRYLEVDLRVFDSLDLLDKKSLLNRRTRSIGDAQNLSEILTDEFNGLIATCLLAHIGDMEAALVNWRRVVKDQGLICIYVPCEPGVILRFARYFTTRKLIEAKGYKHDYIHWKEHRNHYPGMKAIIEKVFIKDKITHRKFPFSKLGWNTNLYAIFVIEVKKKVFV